MSPRPLTREESQARTRTRLLKAAVKVFLRDGFHAASIGQIARAAGYTTGAVYSNFESKEELCIAVLEERFLGLAVDLQQALAAAKPTVEARMAALERWYGNILGSEEWGLLSAEFALSIRKKPGLRDQLASRFAQGRQMIAALLIEQQRQLGVSFGLDPDRLAAAVLGLGMGLMLQRVLDPDVPADTFSEGVRILMGGAVRPTRRAAAG
jgi:AcrR family transcriptional regulator